MPNGMVNVQEVLSQLEGDIGKQILSRSRELLSAQHAGEQLPAELPLSELWEAINRAHEEVNGPPSEEDVEESNRVLSMKFTSYP